MTDIDYGAVFGVDLGENAQETAAPADTNEVQGAKEQETAEPAEQEETTTDSSDAAEQDDHEQSPELRAKFAAIRRKAEAERDEAIAKAKASLEAEHKKKLDEMYAHSGMVNPYTKKPIANKEEYDAYLDQHAAERKQAVMRKTGMNDAEYEEYISSLPEVREAREAKQQAEIAQQAAREEAAKVRIDEQIKEITAIDPAVKSLDDITKMPTYNRFYELVKKGNTLVDAYRLANMDTLMQGAVSASRQQALNTANGKQHLDKTQSRGQGAVSVPDEVKAEYRLFNPTASDAEIQAHYNKYKK